MLFYATGIMPFTMFNTMSEGVAGAVSSNRGLLTYPVVTALDAVFAKFVLNFLTTRSWWRSCSSPASSWSPALT